MKEYFISRKLVNMNWEVKYTDEFGEWWGAKHNHMRKLITQHDDHLEQLKKEGLIDG